ncbi:MAG: hypothetical protein WC712_14990 [Candidatus Brocadiia bacterium]
MSDKQTKTGQDTGKTPSNKPEAPPAIKNPRVGVVPKPRDPRSPEDREVARKVREGVKKKVEEAIEGAQDQGWQKQLDAAKEAAGEEGKHISRRRIKWVKVHVDGDKGKKPDDIHREILVIPSEEGGGSPPQKGDDQDRGKGPKP